MMPVYTRQCLLFRRNGTVAETGESEAALPDPAPHVADCEGVLVVSARVHASFLHVAHSEPPQPRIPRWVRDAVTEQVLCEISPDLGDIGVRVVAGPRVTVLSLHDGGTFTPTVAPDIEITLCGPGP